MFETSVRSRTPRSTTPRISASGLPDRPKPPTMIVMPSRSGASASAIDATTLLRVCRVIRRAPNAATAASPNARMPVTSSCSVMHSGGEKIAVPRLPSTCSDSLRAASSLPSVLPRGERRLDLERAEQAERAHERLRARARAATASSSRRSTGPERAPRSRTAARPRRPSSSRPPRRTRSGARSTSGPHASTCSSKCFAIRSCTITAPIVA